MAAVDRFWGLVAGLDARTAAPGGGRARLDYDGPPGPGDVVLVYDGERVRAVVFDEVVRPWGPTWIIAVLRRA